MSLIRVGFTARSCFSTLTSNGQKRLQKHDEFSQHDQDSREEEKTNRKRADKDEDIQSKILEAALKFVPEHGRIRSKFEYVDSNSSYCCVLVNFCSDKQL